MFLQLTSGLKDQYQLYVATNTHGRFSQELNKLDVQTLPVSMSRQLSFKPILQIMNIVRQNNIDLIHSQGARADFFARIGGRLAGVSNILCTVAMPVEGFEVSPLRKRTYRLMDRLTEPFVRRFIVVSESARQILVAERQISTERVVKVYNGVELDQLYPTTRKSTIRKACGIGADEIVVGSVGRLVWQKGFEYLLRAIPKITENQPNSRFLFVGEGPLRNRLEDLAKNLNILHKVIFTGFLADVNEVLANIDILVIPSVLEGFPMITLEAMAMQKPIVATHIPGISEQISDGEEGILVPPGDPRALAKAVLLLVKDKELASKVGNSARQRAEKNFSVEKMVAATEKVYRCILNGG